MTKKTEKKPKKKPSKKKKAKEKAMDKFFDRLNRIDSETGMKMFAWGCVTVGIKRGVMNPMIDMYSGMMIAAGMDPADLPGSFVDKVKEGLSSVGIAIAEDEKDKLIGQIVRQQNGLEQQILYQGNGILLNRQRIERKQQELLTCPDSADPEQCELSIQADIDRTQTVLDNTRTLIDSLRVQIGFLETKKQEILQGALDDKIEPQALERQYFEEWLIAAGLGYVTITFFEQYKARDLIGDLIPG